MGWATSGRFNGYAACDTSIGVHLASGFHHVVTNTQVGHPAL